jgi:hypothetical protein
VSICAVGAFVFYLFQRFHQSEEMEPHPDGLLIGDEIGDRNDPKEKAYCPNFIYNGQWFRRMLCTDGTGFRSRIEKGVNIDTFQAAMTACFGNLNIECHKKAHWGRRNGGTILEMHGLGPEDRRELGTLDISV